jgi:hypothetical protein
MKATASVHRRGHPAGFWLGDGLLFPHARPENLQGPLRAMGYQFASDLPDDYLGQQTSHQGALMVEGAWMCCATPTTLIDATKTFRAEIAAINQRGKTKELNAAEVELARREKFDTWQSRLEQRQNYALKQRERTIEPGGRIPFACPAGITLKCAVKEKILAEHDKEVAAKTGAPVKHRPPARKPNGDPLLPIPAKNLPLRPLTICKNIKSTSFDPDAGVRFEQLFTYGLEEQRAAYDLRAVVEGFNGYSKSSVHEGLGLAERRLIRGHAGQYFLVSLLVAAANLRKIQSFLDKWGAEPYDVDAKGPNGKRLPRPDGKKHVPTALPKRQVKPNAVGAYAHHLPADPSLELASDMLDRHRERADKRNTRGPVGDGATVSDIEDYRSTERPDIVA